MKVATDLSLTGARPGDGKQRLPRIPSERSDITMLVAALRSLCDQVAEVLGPPGSLPHLPLRQAIYDARGCVYRAIANRDHRDARKPRRKASRRAA